MSNFWEKNVGNTGFYVAQDARSTCRMNSGVHCVSGVLLVSCVCIFFLPVFVLVDHVPILPAFSLACIEDHNSPLTACDNTYEAIV